MKIHKGIIDNPVKVVEKRLMSMTSESGKSCSICNSTFATKSSCLRHMLKFHNENPSEDISTEKNSLEKQKHQKNSTKENIVETPYLRIVTRVYYKK